MHPHAGRDACNSPEEWADAVSREGSELVSAPGYLLIPQGRRGGRGGQGSQRAKSSRAWEAGDVDAANVAHFLHLLRQKCPPWSAQRSAPQHAYLDWLLKQDPAALHSDGPGLKVRVVLVRGDCSACGFVLECIGRRVDKDDKLNGDSEINFVHVPTF